MKKSKATVVPIETILTADNRYQIRQSNAVFSVAHDATSGFVAITTNGITCGINVGLYFFARQFISFDLSSITGTIISANIKIPNIYESNATEAVSIQSCTNTGALSANDFNSIDSVLLGFGATKISTPYIGHIVDFNASGVSKLNEKGVQRFVFRDYDYDYLNIAPTLSTSVVGTVSSFAILTINSI
jgi:hypothetical protein